MKPELKKDIKEWLEIIALAAIGGLVVFHINGTFLPKSENGKKTVKTEISKPAATNDTIAQHVLNNARQLKR